MEYLKTRYNDINVYYLPEIDGGGSNKRDYVCFLEESLGRVDRVFEWCAGPGFIGFWLLSEGFCNTLCLADINPTAVAACQTTVRKNHLQDLVSVYQSNCFDSIPESESWDLVIGNPPHSGTSQPHSEWGGPLLYMDDSWSIHRRFYSGVGRYLKSRSNIVIQENRELASSDDFSPMIEDGGLALVGSYLSRTDPRMYYVWSVTSGSTP